MIILGIDPGTLVCGYGVLEVTSQNGFQVLSSGIIRFKSSDPFFLRLKILHQQFMHISATWRPDQIAFESPIFVKNPHALIKLSQARGAILTAFDESYVEKIFDYSPNLVKKTAAGFGHADKLSGQKAVEYLVGKNSFQTHDESDAILVAICHALLQPQNKNHAMISSLVSTHSNPLKKLPKTKKKYSLANAVEHKMHD